MLLSLRKNSLTSLFKEVRVFRERPLKFWKHPRKSLVEGSWQGSRKEKCLARASRTRRTCLLTALWGERSLRFGLCNCQSLAVCDLGPKLLHYITLVFRINFPDYLIFFTLQYWFRIIFQLSNVFCCCKAYHVGIRLHYRIVFELIYRLCNSFLHYRIGFELIM